MSTWEKVTRDGTEPLNTADDKIARQRFAAMMDQRLMHLRVGGRRQDGTHVEPLGNARELHGPDGCCTCCPRRSA